MDWAVNRPAWLCASKIRGYAGRESHARQVECQGADGRLSAAIGRPSDTTRSPVGVTASLSPCWAASRPDRRRLRRRDRPGRLAGSIQGSPSCATRCACFARSAKFRRPRSRSATGTRLDHGAAGRPARPCPVGSGHSAQNAPQEAYLDNTGLTPGAAHRRRPTVANPGRLSRARRTASWWP